MATVFFCGDTRDVGVTLPDAVESGATVTAGLREPRSNALLAGPWSVLEATPGSAWAVGLVMVSFDGADTAELTRDRRNCELVIKVVYSGDTRTYVVRDCVLEAAAL